MIVHYNISSGEILGYFSIGSIPDSIPDGEMFMEWSGVTPEPIYNYEVVNSQVVLKSQSDIDSYKTSIKLRAIRGERDQLLKDSDYTQFTDSTHPGTKAEWATYRQSLRDITDQTDLDNITWPVKPT